MVIHDKYIYIHMPKTGGTFVSIYLQDNIENSNYFGPGYGHQPISSERVRYPNHYIFGTIRNPWDWYVSIFEFNKSGGNYFKFIKDCDYNFDKFITRLLTKKEGAMSRMRFNRASELNIGMFTYQYILMFTKNPNEVFEKKTDYWVLGVDQLIRIEDITTELLKMFKNHIFELTDKQKNELLNMKRLNTTEHKHYREYYTEETKNLVYEKDRILIESYNYEF